MSQKYYDEAATILREHAAVAAKNGLNVPDHIDIEFVEGELDYCGHYDPQTNKIVVDTDMEDWRDTVKHELVHALQKKNYGGAMGHGDSFDEVSKQAGMGLLDGRGSYDGSSDIGSIFATIFYIVIFCAIASAGFFLVLIA